MKNNIVLHGFHISAKNRADKQALKLARMIQFIYPMFGMFKRLTARLRAGYSITQVEIKNCEDLIRKIETTRPIK